MDRLELHFPWLLLSSNPDCARAADQRKGIIADDFGWTVQFKLDRGIGKWTDVSEFIGDANDNASRVGAIGNQIGVVRHQREFRVDAFSGKLLRDHLLALDVTLDSQVSPFVK